MGTDDAISQKARFKRHRSLPVCVDEDVRLAIDVNAEMPIVGSEHKSNSSAKISRSRANLIVESDMNIIVTEMTEAVGHPARHIEAFMLELS
ncbi:hypothetical protein V6N13_148085 [Hibiscus sabdariffa]